jgi:hypothetical protein
MFRKTTFALLALAASAAALPAAAQTTCSASSSWVNNPTLPSSLDESNQCNFQIFSWQSFLALVQPSGSSGQLVFETYMSSDGLFVPDGQKPLAWGNEPWPLTLGGITLQAGSSNDLVAQSGVEVQYDMSVNQTMYDYVTGDTLYNATCFNNGGNNVHVPPSENVATDPQSIELKTAWLPMSPCDSTKYHCVTALVNNQKTTVGLIGFHVVHKLPDHQEWIWSTFEHVDNSPDCAQVSNPPSGYSSWSFFKTGFVPVGKSCTACASEDGSGCDAATECNTFVSDTTIPNICRTQQLTTLTCDPTQPLSDDVNDVVCLNPSVWNLLPSNSVWRNYMLVGTVWFKPGMTQPDTSGQVPPTGQAFTGNTNLSNTAMETYTQQANPNCLSAGCHTSAFKSIATTGSGGHADFSHMFSRIQAFSQVQCPAISTVSSHGTKAAERTAEAPMLKSSHASGNKK